MSSKDAREIEPGSKVLIFENYGFRSLPPKYSGGRWEENVVALKSGGQIAHLPLHFNQGGEQSFWLTNSGYQAVEYRPPNESTRQRLLSFLDLNLDPFLAVYLAYDTKHAVDEIKKILPPPEKQGWILAFSSEASRHGKSILMAMIAYLGNHFNQRLKATIVSADEFSRDPGVFDYLDWLEETKPAFRSLDDVDTLYQVIAQKLSNFHPQDRPQPQPTLAEFQSLLWQTWLQGGNVLVDTPGMLYVDGQPARKSDEFDLLRHCLNSINISLTQGWFDLDGGDDTLDLQPILTAANTSPQFLKIQLQHHLKGVTNPGSDFYQSAALRQAYFRFAVSGQSYGLVEAGRFSRQTAGWGVVLPHTEPIHPLIQFQNPQPDQAGDD